MKVKDADEWSRVVASLRENETGTAFLAFVTYWADAAENVMARSGISSAGALRAVLGETEQEFGLAGATVLAQLLAVLVLHWEHGEEMAAGLTRIEHRLVEEALVLKIAELQHRAAEVSRAPSS